ncbi:hypothetical protein Zmor_023297 [Zophobas morio]|uniref:Alkaline phosphatase n=1 Tax=Zophobas morio TaxID=2755281 RepID=A0AA38HZP6_9CUCU|nr:hypothetical protein Zmor_023297 [Zophobas morio]
MLKFVILSICCLLTEARPDHLSDRVMHPHPKKSFEKYNSNEENTADFWKTNAIKTLKQAVAAEHNTNVAKNVILFMGDGMSIPTLAATRVYMGGENFELSFEKFPYTAVSKTYCVNYQVADSACTATAYLGGVKANLGTVGVTASVDWEDCNAMTNTSNNVDSIAQWAQVKGKSTGFVTTARVTHASPAGVFGHSAQRDWETDTDIINDGKNASVCTDLATQLVTEDVGKNLNVIMGGGRYAFLPKGTKGDEDDEGYRSDGVNLIEKWKELKESEQAEYIWNREQLLALKPEETDYVLGLFESDHCPFHLERDEALDPTLTEMTEAAINILSKNSEGYFLFVEGARIDMGHHQAMAHLALEETAEFSRAIERAVNITSENDTLIVVTADHAHTMSISGYPFRGNDILGTEGEAADDGLPFTTINYANGPGYQQPSKNGSRHNISEDDLSNIEYRFSAIFPLDSETHGGDDVLVFAKGPWAHLFRGVIEQNVIPHIMGYASCLGDSNVTACDDNNDVPVSAGTVFTSIYVFVVLALGCLFI